MRLRSIRWLTRAVVYANQTMIPRFASMPSCKCRTVSIIVSIPIPQAHPCNRMSSCQCASLCLHTHVTAPLSLSPILHPFFHPSIHPSLHGPTSHRHSSNSIIAPFNHLCQSLFRHVLTPLSTDSTCPAIHNSRQDCESTKGEEER